VSPPLAPPRAALAAAEGAIVLVLLVEAWLLARALSPAPGGARPSRLPRGAWALPLGLALVFAVPAGLVARSGALAPGVSGAGMPWEAVTDATPCAVAARAGERAYLNRCAPCHLPSGLGLPPAYPPLVGSALLSGPVAAHARVALLGSAALDPRPGHAAMHDGAHGRARMPAFAAAVDDRELSVILTYERAAFGAGGEAALATGDTVRIHVRPGDVAAARGDGL
jgi:mono/diheme cytochrome c family protein